MNGPTDEKKETLSGEKLKKKGGGVVEAFEKKVEKKIEESSFRKGGEGRRVPGMLGRDITFPEASIFCAGLFFGAVLLRTAGS